MARKQTFKDSDNESDVSQGSDSETLKPDQDESLQPQDPLAPSPLSQQAPITQDESTPSSKKRASSNGSVTGELNKKKTKKSKLIGFTESDQEEQEESHLNGNGNGSGVEGKGKKRLLIRNEERKRLREVAKRLEGGRKELPVWEGKFTTTIQKGLGN